ncbi:NIPSNAP family protein [Variovorax sp. CY25R-8]|uniref:NIPSNAP family protein n=1 Tax=Variovorax sp. CY25R-8 TaxID=2855501 RepID=UPI0021BBA983|nr:NIPSNAP family protein [Variovorax sp. CY25R-8]MCT8175679.1 NIPSNAP family protein [Variovorax sp. CY25R-8]
MIFELRTYTAEPGRAADFLKLYERMALPLQNKYLGGLVGFYVSEIGPLNQIVHLWRFASLADREQRRSAMEADPAWQEYRARSKELGALRQQESQILKPTSFSPR